MVPTSERESASPTLYQRIAELVAAVPCGRVATYGQIAAAAGNPRAARVVAWVLRARDDLPWHRIVNSQGGISLPVGGGRERQYALLQDEGIELRSGDDIDLGRYRWPGPT